MDKGKRNSFYAKAQLGDSWVIESDDQNDTVDSDEEEEQSLGLVPSPLTPRRRSPRTSTYKSPEQEFIMPSIHENSIDGSWVAQSPSEPQPKKRTNRSSITEIDNHATSAKSQKRSKTKPRKTSTEEAAGDTCNQIFNSIGAFISPMLGWVLDVVGGAFQAIKTPASYTLALYVALWILTSILTKSINTVLSPFCHVPGASMLMSLLHLPICDVSTSNDYRSGQVAPVEFNQLMTVQSKFEEILEESAGGAGLPQDMKHGEASIRDLRTVVQYSQLHSKNELVLEFDGFIETARIASFDLQKFNSHIGRAVDSVLSTTRWTSRILDDIATAQSSRGAVQAFISDTVLATFQPVKLTEDVLLDQYLKHTRIIEGQINKLIDEAQVLLLVLVNLEDRLDIINDIAVRDDLHASASKEEILMDLWTMLGGNRSKLNKFDRQLDLLKQVGIYRKSAFAHVSGTILKLQSMSAEIESLRERVGEAELLRDVAHIPLSVHIEHIQLGVERLEAGREHARALESEHVRSTMERGEASERLIGGRI